MAERVHEILTAVQREIPNADMRDFFAILNRHMRLLSTVRNWKFYEQTYALSLTAGVQVEDVTVTNGSTTVTCATSTFTAGMAGRKIRVSGTHVRVYEIAAYVSGTEVTLSAAWQGDTASGTASALVFQDEYAAPSNLRRERMLFNESEQCEIAHVPYDAMLSVYYQTQSLSPVRPRIYTFKDFADTSGTEARVMWFESAPDSADALTLYYWRWPTAATQPQDRIDMPLELSTVLLYDVVMHYAARPEYASAIPQQTAAYWGGQRQLQYQEAMRNNAMLSRDIYVTQAPLFAPTRRYGRSWPAGRY